ncbi:response regulator transcription factor [Alkalicoccus daliensis]|uniref:Two-component system, chemotaxis family, response regulator CheY n=1 Tax=Alkalicoccus daliensis TaxID=745820 RepID=A0A1H0I876_9BACI|nr:response regulator [Alkalicoccus daliensis]SDO27311.1 two-component system, chemotaxis family, response regulator CheY [Alkalicoccus daliensis]
MTASTLICDDSAIFREQLKMILNEAGIQKVYEAGNGIEAVQMFLDYEPDLVFMDIIMPKQDGISTLKELVSYKKNSRIIMTSSCSQQSHLRRALHLGADAYLRKPASEQNILPLLQKYNPASF